ASPLIFIGQLFPIIHKLPIIGHFSKGQFVNVVAGLRRTIKEDVERALALYTVDQEPECLVQAYYQKMQSNPNLNYENLLNVCMDFYTAGMETNTTTLRWATLLFASHPHVQMASQRRQTDRRCPIPNTLVLGEIHQILAHSPVFKDGHEYRPERFLMKDGVTPNKIEPAEGREIDLKPIFGGILLPKKQPLRLIPIVH
ncbi:hypothetical protein TELCIR_14717, partial [Teladorsagia circumcincta]